jgi:hypothetical protein
MAGALGYFPYAARTFQVLQEVIHTSYDQECHIFAPTCFPPLVTIYRKVIEWRIQNGTAIHVCRVCVCRAIAYIARTGQTEAQNRKRKSTEDTAEDRTDHDGLRPPHEPLPATVSRCVALACGAFARVVSCLVCTLRLTRTTVNLFPV